MWQMPCKKIIVFFGEALAPWVLFKEKKLDELNSQLLWLKSTGKYKKYLNVICSPVLF
jgi:hypothetical protein